MLGTVTCVSAYGIGVIFRNEHQSACFSPHNHCCSFVHVYLIRKPLGSGRFIKNTQHAVVKRHSFDARMGRPTAPLLLATEKRQREEGLPISAFAGDLSSLNSEMCLSMRLSICDCTVVAIGVGFNAAGPIFAYCASFLLRKLSEVRFRA